MGFFGYIKTWFTKKTDEMKDPAIEIEQAIQEAQKREPGAAQSGRHGPREPSARGAGASRSQQATSPRPRSSPSRRCSRPTPPPRPATRSTPRSGTTPRPQIALKMQAAQNSQDMYQKQLITATAQAEAAKKAVQQNAMAVQEMAAERMQMLGQLEAAKMQESVNRAMDAMNAQVGDTGTLSLDAVNDKIKNRMAVAQAQAEIKAATPDGAIAELKMSTGMLKAEAALDDLRAELGLDTAHDADRGDDEARHTGRQYRGAGRRGTGFRAARLLILPTPPR